MRLKPKWGGEEGRRRGVKLRRTAWSEMTKSVWGQSRTRSVFEMERARGERRQTEEKKNRNTHRARLLLEMREGSNA